VIPLKMAHVSVFIGVSGCKSVINHHYRCRNMKKHALICCGGRKGWGQVSNGVRKSGGEILDF